MKKLLASISAAALLFGIAGASLAAPAGDHSKNIVIAQADKMEDGKMAGKKKTGAKMSGKKKAGAKMAGKKKMGGKMAGKKSDKMKPAAK